MPIKRLFSYVKGIFDSDLLLSRLVGLVCLGPPGMTLLDGGGSEGVLRFLTLVHSPGCKAYAPDRQPLKRAQERDLSR